MGEDIRDETGDVVLMCACHLLVAFVDKAHFSGVDGHWPWDIWSAVEFTREDASS